jgi:small conductance mechanosensitive channel
MLDTAIQKNANADAARETLDKQYRDQVDAGAGAIELRPLRLKIDEAEQRLAESRAEIQDRMKRLQELQNERALYLSAREASRRETDQMRAQLEEAQKNLKKASNPFSFDNLKRRTVESGPVVLGILIGMFLLQWLVNLSGRRIVKLMANQGARGARQEREDRANTLVSVFGNFATLAIFIGGGMMILDEVGIPIGPLLGGAAVVGFAIGFGAQNLVRDYFSGFMILLENQYKLKDVVKIGDHAGSVEQITMRMTALRDLEGNLHFLPNGEIKSVINMTHGWSRALFDIGVAYKENVDHVMNVILEVGQELRQDKKFRLLILEDPTMLGVDAFGDSAVVIKFFIKTLPLKQWDVKREMLRRLKNRFDELGIEIPFPQRTIHHQTSNDQLLEALANQPQQDPYQNHPR